MYKIAYTSSSINQTTTASHWGANNVICYANSEAVYIYDPFYGSGGKVTHTLFNHASRITSTRWIFGKPYETELVVGSSDGTVTVWSKIVEEFVPTIVTKCKAKVNIADGCYGVGTTANCILVIATLDNSVRVVKRDTAEGDFTETQTINLGKHVPMSLKLSYLPNTNEVIFVVGTDTGKFMLFSETEANEFHKNAELNAHTAWLQYIDCTKVGCDLWFATASQDATIKIWKISVCNKSTPDKPIIPSLTYNNVQFRKNEIDFALTLCTTIYGHDSWVNSVNFNKKNLELLSTSADKIMIIWRKTDESDIWTEKCRFGEMASDPIGYLAGMFGPNGDLFAYGGFGAFHFWTYEEGYWKPSVTVGGHSDAVVDVAWEPSGQFIYTASHDQTTRIHAPWIRDNKQATWHEIARPQIHGYDMSCLGILSRFEYVSGAEEKVVRGFKAPQNFIRKFRETKLQHPNENEDIPQAASVGPLGLTNKAVYEDDTFHAPFFKDEQNEESKANFIERPPTEETLTSQTLWIEACKLYAHGNDIYSMAATHDGKILATACKASTDANAAILLWDTTSWVKIDTLIAHNLTVCQMEFSPNSKYLLSVSRDRSWNLFSIDQDGKYKLCTFTKAKKIHTRIIWCCTWFSNSEYFVTGSRDGKTAIWKLKSDTNETVPYVLAGPFLDLKGESITAVAVAPICVKDSGLLAIGLESGVIHLYLWNEKTEVQQWQLYITINEMDAHHKTVKRLAFRKQIGRAESSDNNNVIQLASCGSDNVVRVFDITI